MPQFREIAQRWSESRFGQGAAVVAVSGILATIVAGIVYPASRSPVLSDMGNSGYDLLVAGARSEASDGSQGGGGRFEQLR